MAQFDTVASDEAIETTLKNLTANGFVASVAENSEAAKKAVLDLIPKGAEILTSTSRTLETLGLDKILNESGDYDAVRPKLNAMWGDESKKRDQRKLGAAPDYVIGSVHAVTEEGEVLIASNTGSQLPGYTYGAGTVIWVVGAQKIVKDMPEAHQRLEQHVFPLEDERSKQAYGSPSFVSKLLEYRREVTPERVHIVIVKEALGF
jgi:L-lactate utilization protein LutB